MSQHDSHLHRYRHATSRKCADRCDSIMSTAVNILTHELPHRTQTRSPRVPPPSSNNMGLLSRLDRPAFLATTVQRSPEEKALVRRLDCFLLFFGCVSQVIKYLDQQNIKFELSEPSNSAPMLISDDLAMRMSQACKKTSTFKGTNSTTSRQPSTSPTALCSFRPRSS